jgi:TonB-dependent starch-binding outer membrane protein SusC
MYDAIGIFATQGELDSYPHWNKAKPGDVKFRDVNGDNKIDGNDRILVDNVDAPENYYGIEPRCNLERLNSYSSCSGTR